MMILNSIEFLRDFAVESLPMRKQVLRQTNTLQVINYVERLEIDCIPDCACKH